MAGMGIAESAVDWGLGMDVDRQGQFEESRSRRGNTGGIHSLGEKLFL